jgi:hypothetical protein
VQMTTMRGEQRTMDARRAHHGDGRFGVVAQGHSCIALLVRDAHPLLSPGTPRRQTHHGGLARVHRHLLITLRTGVEGPTQRHVVSSSHNEIVIGF